ncbi:MAG: hypothetical protein Q9170_003305 [Blastenia crenularia]
MAPIPSTSVKHSRISKYRAKSNHLSDSEWEDLLRSCLLQEHSESAKKDNFSTDLEIVSSITDTKLTITLRKSISGIHQKLGEFSLSHDPSADINVLDWANTAIVRASALQSEAHNLQKKLVEQTQMVKQLNQQLDELIQAKKDHEEALLLKCALLLNEKKRKIRQQQRQLNTAKEDPKKLKEMQESLQASAPRRSPDTSKNGKRKAATPTASSDEDGFEDDAVKIEEREDQQPDSEEVTPQHSDLDETDDEVDNADLDSISAPPTAKGEVNEVVETHGGLDQDDGVREMEDVEMPPRREPPFMKGVDDGKQKDLKEQDAKMADDDETDDDEL